MSNGGQPNPRLRIDQDFHKDLERLGCYPWSFHAGIMLQFIGTRSRDIPSPRLPFRLDTGAFVSVIPKKWIQRHSPLSHYLGNLSKESVSFQTATGPGEGQMVSNVSVCFADAPQHQFFCDFLVASSPYKRDYGLLSLRDVLQHFSIQTEGFFPS